MSALSAGAHWYYDVAQQQERYGSIDYYVKPKADWYHAGLEAGDWSQSAEQAVLLLDSLTADAANGCHYRQQDFCSRFDTLLDSLQLDEMPWTGRAGYVDRQVRDVANCRRKKRLEWTDDELGTWTDTSEASQRSIVLCARYAYEPTLSAMSQQVWQNTRLTYCDPLTISHTLAYAALITLLIQGRQHTLSSLQPAMMGAVKDGLYGLTDEPEHSQKLKDRAQLPHADDPTRRSSVKRSVNNPDALLLPVFMLKALEPPASLTFADDRYASYAWGQSCSIPFVLGSTYHVSSKHRTDFNAAVLTALAGGGQTVARCAHVGGLVGAQVGLSGIERRWITGLRDGARLEAMAKQVAEAGAKDWAEQQKREESKSNA